MTVVIGSARSGTAEAVAATGRPEPNYLHRLAAQAAPPTDIHHDNEHASCVSLTRDHGAAVCRGLTVEVPMFDHLTSVYFSFAAAASPRGVFLPAPDGPPPRRRRWAN